MDSVIRSYYRADLSDLQDWLELRGLPRAEAHWFPSIGFIAPGLAVGFLFQTDSSLAFLDNYISNPTADSFRVGRAVSKITDRLLAKAEQLGFDYVKCATDKGSVKKMALRKGFKNVGEHTCFFKEI